MVSTYRFRHSLFFASIVWPLVAIGTGERAERSAAAADPRSIRTGWVIPDEGYCDQPYIVVTADGNWLCVLTTCKGAEGEGSQHVVSTISADRGRTWTPLVDIEPADGPEASWVMPLVVPSGRVYAFYVYNGDRIDTLQGKKGIRADMLGWYVYRWSDDHGRTWSHERERLPVKVTACDRENDWSGAVQILWGIGKPIIVDGSAIFGFTKVGKYMLDNSEGWFMRSDNILAERDASRIEWRMLPVGEVGLRAPEFGSIQSEHNLVALSETDLYCIYRTTTGYPCHTYSHDGGQSWTKPEHATYRPGGKKIKNPRACPRLWRTRAGNYLLWFHNHSGRDFHGRNPAWIVGGVVKKGHIHWSQPEILLYDPEPDTRISYPDLIEADGRYWISETQKSVARVHEVDATLLEGLWSQESVQRVVQKGLVLSCDAEQLRGRQADMPRLPDLSQGGGFSIDLGVAFDDLAPGQILADTRSGMGNGIALTTTSAGTIRLDLGDGKNQASWDCDPGVLEPGKSHHVVVTVDGGPKIITFVVDGVVCDGGTHRQYGWGRFGSELGNVSASDKVSIAQSLNGKLTHLRIYARPLRNAEAAGNLPSVAAE